MPSAAGLAPPPIIASGKPHPIRRRPPSRSPPSLPPPSPSLPPSLPSPSPLPSPFSLSAILAVAVAAVAAAHLAPPSLSYHRFACRPSRAQAGGSASKRARLASSSQVSTSPLSLSSPPLLTASPPFAPAPSLTHPPVPLTPRVCSCVQAEAGPSTAAVPHHQVIVATALERSSLRCLPFLPPPLGRAAAAYLSAYHLSAVSLSSLPLLPHTPPLLSAMHRAERRTTLRALRSLSSRSALRKANSRLIAARKPPVPVESSEEVRGDGARKPSVHPSRARRPPLPAS